MKRFLSQRRVSIQTQIILPYMILVFFLLAAAAYIGTRILFDSIQERFTNQLIEAGKLASDGMVRQEDAMLATLRLLANTQGTAGALQNADADTLRRLALPVAVNVQQDAVMYLDVNGIAVLSMTRVPQGELTEYSYSSGGSAMASWDIVRSVLHQKQDSHGDKFAGVETTPLGDYFFVAGPVYDAGGGLAGVVLVGQSARHLADALREQTLAQITLYAPGGRVVATTFADSPVLDSVTSGAVLRNQASDSLIRPLRLSDIDYSEVLGAWKARGGTIGVEGTAFAQNFLVRFSRQRWLLLLASAVTSLLLVTAVGLFIARNIGEPVQRLERAASRVADGDLNVHVRPSGRDEITELTREFNSMVDSLHQSRQDLVSAYDSTIEAWAKTLELYDNETLGHSQRVTELTLQLARSLGVPQEQLVQIRRGALLHDIGKLTVPIQILNKPGPLTPAEQEIVHRHPAAAYEILHGIGFLAGALDIPYCHHERWDGSGYPRGLQGQEIPLSARLFTAVDVWDALRSDRPYRKSLPRGEAIDLMLEGSGSLFDPDVVQALLKIV